MGPSRIKRGKEIAIMYCNTERDGPCISSSHSSLRDVLGDATDKVKGALNEYTFFRRISLYELNMIIIPFFFLLSYVKYFRAGWIL